MNVKKAIQEQLSHRCGHNQMVAGLLAIVDKAIRHDREVGGVIDRNRPVILTGEGQGWIENPDAVKRILNRDFSPMPVETITRHTVDLSASPRLPFDNAEVVKHEGKGIVEIELRSDDNLYIDGKEVVPHLSERQMGDK